MNYLPDVARRIYLSLLHSGYLRNYLGAIRILCERGHHVHVALVRDEKHPGDDYLLEQLAAEHETFSYGAAPTLPRNGRLAGLAGLVRMLQDVSRYAHPDYATANALRERSLARAGGTRRATRLLRGLARPTTAGRLRRRLALLRLVDRAIPPVREITEDLRSFSPDVVLASPVVEYGSTQVDYLKSARALGVATGVCVASWDNLTNKGLVRFRPDRLFVWNDLQRREAVRYHDIPVEVVQLTGAARFDPWFEREPATTPEEFAQRVGLGGTGHILYLCSSGFVAPDELAFVRRWLATLRGSSDAAPAAAPVLVRPHPHNARQWYDADLSEFGDVAVHPRVGTHPDEGDPAADFYDSIAHSRAVVGVNTSALIESAIVGRSVYTVLDPQFADSQEGTLHFHYLRSDQGGFVHEATSLEEHVRQLAQGLEREQADEEDRVKTFVERFVRPCGLNLPAAQVMADAFAALAETSRAAR
jgi:hypothetical protein